MPIILVSQYAIISRQLSDLRVQNITPRTLPCICEYIHIVYKRVSLDLFYSISYLKFVANTEYVPLDTHMSLSCFRLLFWNR